MNYYQPRQLLLVLKEDPRYGKWDYTIMNDGIVHAVGYCAEAGGGHHVEKDECYTCYRNYLLETKLVLNAGKWAVKYKCKVKECEEWTQDSAEIMGHMLSFELCPTHMTKETVEKLFPEVGDFISSY